MQRGHGLPLNESWQALFGGHECEAVSSHADFTHGSKWFGNDRTEYRVVALIVFTSIKQMYHR